MKPFVLGLALALAAVCARAEPYSFLEARAEDGDGMYTLLRRYGLPRSSCYRDQFRHLNDLPPEHTLHVGRPYRLPVLVYAYDGTPIRSTLGVDDLALARLIQRYNRDREAADQQAGAYEETGELWVPYGLLFCDREGGAPELAADAPAPAEAIAVSRRVEVATPPPASREGRGYAIFGEKYAVVPRKGSELRGRVFYLVSGHGGPDPGAVGSKRDRLLCEDEYAYDVVLRLAREIIAHGGKAYVIVRDSDGIRDEEFLACDTDEVVWGNTPLPRDQRARLAQRSDVINGLAREERLDGTAAQYCVVVHVDSRHADAQTDLFFYHQRDSRTSEAVAEEMRATMARNYRRNGRTREYTGKVITRDLHMLREVDVPTVYIELGNIQHGFDQKRVLRTGNRQALANWFTEGIVRAVADEPPPGP